VTVHQGHILKSPGGIYPRGLVPVLRRGAESTRSLHSKGNSLKSASTRRDNLKPRNDWLRDEFAKKREKNPGYSVEQFRNSLKKSRKFARELRPHGKLICTETLRTILAGSHT